MKRLFAVAILTLVAACATAPQNAEQTVFQARTAQNVALRAAIGYAELPACREPKVQPCADKEVVDQLKLASRVTDQALTAAETAVRTPGFGTNVISSAVAAGTSALAAFQTIVATLSGGK